MRDPTRIPEMLNEIMEVWQKHPDMRLGQLLINCFPHYWESSDIFYIEDDKFLKSIEEWGRNHG